MHLLAHGSCPSSIPAAFNGRDIKVNGKGDFNLSIDLKKLFDELRHRGFQRFVLELCDCVMMDSTFLGLLAGIALKSGGDNGASNFTLELINLGPVSISLFPGMPICQLIVEQVDRTPFRNDSQFHPLLTDLIHSSTFRSNTSRATLRFSRPRRGTRERRIAVPSNASRIPALTRPAH